MPRGMMPSLYWDSVSKAFCSAWHSSLPSALNLRSDHLGIQSRVTQTNETTRGLLGATVDDRSPAWAHIPISKESWQYSMY